MPPNHQDSKFHSMEKLFVGVMTTFRTSEPYRSYPSSGQKNTQRQPWNMEELNSHAIELASLSNSK